MENKTVTIAALNPRSIDNPIFVTPAFDESVQGFVVGTKTYKARPIHDKNGETVAYESIDAPLPLRTTKGRPFKHGEQFDLNDPKDQLLIDMLIDQGFLARDGERPNPAQHRFFMQDRMADAKRAVDRGTLQSKALQVIGSMTIEDKMNLAFIEKQPVARMSDLEVDGFCYNLAQTNPAKVVDTYGDKTFKVRAFVQKLISYQILTSGSNGIKYGSDLIALDMDNAVAWMQSVENKEKIQLFRDELGKRSGSSNSARKANAAAEGGAEKSSKPADQ